MLSYVTIVQSMNVLSLFPFCFVFETGVNLDFKKIFFISRCDRQFGIRVD